ncbi:MAG: anti-sigma factor antagonist [Desulfobacteraceae bacterium]|nr:MAG: anti-sigma factor antagonist [Desulfobacteraceae bacterium]
MSSNIVEINSSKDVPIKGGSRTIIPLKDALTYQNCAALETAFEEAIQNNRSEIILDCKALTFIDSKVLELLVRMHEDLKKSGGALRMIGLNDVCRDILTATRLINFLNIYKDIHGAIRKWP